MAEYMLHILNWPCEGESPEDAVRKAVESGGLENFVFTVTDREGVLVPKGLMANKMAEDWEVREEVDTTEWEGLESEVDQGLEIYTRVEWRRAE